MKFLTPLFNKTNNAFIVFFKFLHLTHFLKDNPSSTISNISTIIQWAKEKFDKENVLYHFTSLNSYLVYFVKKGQKPPQVLESCINDIISMSNKCLELNFFIKGAIAYGQVITGKNFLIGSPLNRAIKYTSKLKSPMVIFPQKEFDNLELSNLLSPISNSAMFELDTKSQIISCHAILPPDINIFLKKMETQFEYFKKNEKKHLALYWSKQLQFIRDEFIIKKE